MPQFGLHSVSMRPFCLSGGKNSMRKSERYRIALASANGAFNGIVHILRDECGGNPPEKGIVSISASTNCTSGCHKLVDCGSNFTCRDGYHV